MHVSCGSCNVYVVSLATDDATQRVQNLRRFAVVTREEIRLEVKKDKRPAPLSTPVTSRDYVRMQSYGAITAFTLWTVASNRLLLPCRCTKWHFRYASTDALVCFYSLAVVKLLSKRWWIPQARGLKGRRSWSLKGREQRWCSRPLTRGFRAFKALCWAFITFK